MINSNTGKKVIVFKHDELGPVIEISDHNDWDLLEDILSDSGIIYEMKFKKLPYVVGDNRYYLFGNAVDITFIQKVIDEY